MTRTHDTPAVMDFTRDTHECKDFMHPNPGFTNFAPGPRSNSFLFPSPSAFAGRHTSLSPLPPPPGLSSFHSPPPSLLSFPRHTPFTHSPAYWFLDQGLSPPTASAFGLDSQLLTAQPSAASHLPAANRHQNTPLQSNPGNLPDLSTSGTTLPSTHQQARSLHFVGSDEPFLDELVSRDWSSPSLPARSPTVARHPRLDSDTDRVLAHECMRTSPAVTVRFGHNHITNSVREAESRVSTLLGLLNASGNSDTDTLPAPPHLDLESSPPIMPAVTRGARKRSSGGETPMHPPKRSKTATAISSRSRVYLKQEDRSEVQGGLKLEDDDARDMLLAYEDEEHEVIDLVDDKVPESLLDAKKDISTKLSAFQCVICMDNVCALTVTHCGHLFCSECLHSSLHINGRKICPICRQKIDVKPASGKFSSKAKGYYQLELKLMTPKRLGKRKAA